MHRRCISFSGYFCSGYRDEKIYSIDCGDEAAAWISRYVLEKDSGLRLGYHDGKHRRDISKTHEPFLRVYKSLSNRCIVSIISFQ